MITVAESTFHATLPNLPHPCSSRTWHKKFPSNITPERCRTPETIGDAADLPRGRLNSRRNPRKSIYRPSNALSRRAGNSVPAGTRSRTSQHVQNDFRLDHAAALPVCIRARIEDRARARTRTAIDLDRSTASSRYTC